MQTDTYHIKKTVGRGNSYNSGCRVMLLARCLCHIGRYDAGDDNKSFELLTLKFTRVQRDTDA